MTDTKTFEILVESGKNDDALRWLNSASIDDGLEGCMNLVIKTKKLEVIDTLLQKLGGNTANKACFCLTFAKRGTMPQGQYSLTDSEYDNARTHYLKLLDKKKRIQTLVGLWSGGRLFDDIAFRQATAKKVPFYPELISRYNNHRSRVGAIAKAHANLGPNHPQQINLFSLGGRYGFGNASAGTSPTGLGTTCMLTVRAIWHAAGLNVTNKALSTSVINGSLSKEFEDMNCYVPVTKGSQPSLKEGDIFQIDDPPRERKDTTGRIIGAAHVGLYLGTSGNQGNALVWDIVQGGAPNHVTVRRDYTLDADLRFTNDLYTWGARRLVGYWDIDRVDNSYWMDYSPPTSFNPSNAHLVCVPEMK